MASLENKFNKLKVAGEPLADVTGNRGNALATEWSEIKPMAYDYDVYKAEGQEQQKLIEGHIAKPKEEPDMTAIYTADVPLWASDAMRYEWNDDYGEVGPTHKELETQLFHDKFQTRAGTMFDNITKIKAVVECESASSAEKVRPIASFETAGLHPVVVQNIALCGYRTPTPIQAYCIPAVMNNYDVLAIAQTGSGKTAAFLIPVLSKLMGKAKKLAAPRPRVTPGFDPSKDGVRAEPLVLVVCPTRELATQIFDEARRLCYRSMLRPCVAYGGAPTRSQKDELRKGCDILIATPGRLMDFMNQPRLLSLARVRFTIIDEADEMVDTDWNEDMKMILSGGDNNEDVDHRYMMFSATFPKGARQVAKALLSTDHVRIRVGRIGSTHDNVKQDVVFVDETDKQQAIFDLLMSMPPARTIIFVNQKKTADYLDDFLFNRGLPSTSIHADRSQREREDALRAFRSGKAPILIATGVSARGLDIINVMHVINYDLPSRDHEGIKGYIHRIGRTARIGNNGLATSFYNTKNEDIAEDLVKLLLEAKQEVPDFLEHFKPEDTENLNFHDASDEEDLADVVSGNDPTGGADPWGLAKADDDDGWGAPAAASADDAWGAPVAASADDSWGVPAPRPGPSTSTRPVDKGKGKAALSDSASETEPARQPKPAPEPSRTTKPITIPARKTKPIPEPVAVDDMAW